MLGLMPCLDWQILKNPQRCRGVAASTVAQARACTVAVRSSCSSKCACWQYRLVPAVLLTVWVDPIPQPIRLQLGQGLPTYTWHVYSGFARVVGALCSPVCQSLAVTCFTGCHFFWFRPSSA